MDPNSDYAARKSTNAPKALDRHSMNVLGAVSSSRWSFDHMNAIAVMLRRQVRAAPGKK